MKAHSTQTGWFYPRFFKKRFKKNSAPLVFNRSQLEKELLHLNLASMTGALAKLISGDIEKEIKRRRPPFLSSGYLSEMVVCQLEALGLIESAPCLSEDSHPAGDPQILLTEDVLEILTPFPRVQGVKSLNENESRHERSSLHFSVEALHVLNSQILNQDDRGQLIETPSELFSRVAKTVALVDQLYDPQVSLSQKEDEYYELMAAKEFYPEETVFKQAGLPKGQLLSFFGLPLEESADTLFDVMKEAAVLGQTGRQMSFSLVQNASQDRNEKRGPETLIEFLEVVKNTILETGLRKQKIQLVLDSEHPGLIDFFSSHHKKQWDDFSLCFAMKESFLEQVKTDQKLPNGQESARDLFFKLLDWIWHQPETSVVFSERIQKSNPTPWEGELQPAMGMAHQPLLFYEGCALGSLNLQAVGKSGSVNWTSLAKLVTQAVCFLDNVLEASYYPLPKIEERVRKNRKLGIGVMGFATLLDLLEIPYFSEDALKLAEEVMAFIQKEAWKASVRLAEKRGFFPNATQSNRYHDFTRSRHASLTAIFPNPLQSLLAGVTSSIEPGPWPGSGNDLLWSSPAKFHLKLEAAFQKYTDNAVIKQIPLGPKATKKDLVKLFISAFELGVKGFVVSRQHVPQELQIVSENTAQIPSNADWPVILPWSAEATTYFVPSRDH